MYLFCNYLTIMKSCTLSMITINGAANVDKAFKIVEQKSPDNPKRIFGYVIGILDKMKGSK